MKSDEFYRTYYKMLDKNEEFFSKAMEMAKEIKEKAIKIFDDCEVFVVGSYARGEHTLSSDLDILIVSDKVPEKFDFEWYSSLVKKLTDDNKINIHPVNREKFKKLERAYIPRISV